ncbi:MAG: polyhydroxyalkanoate synthesis regulator DNA-binding domain-containing protein [Candidatus Binatia bacterium]
MTRLIKRYGNRKMYDTQASRYVTLDGVAELVRAGEDLRIIDNETGEDLTAVTFAQIIFEEQKRQNGLLGLPVLRWIIQQGGETVHEILSSVDRGREALDSVRELAEKGMQQLAQSTGVQRGAGRRRPARDGSKPGRRRLLNDIFETPQKQIEQLQQRIDAQVRASFERVTAHPAFQNELRRVEQSIKSLEQQLGRLRRRQKRERQGRGVKGPRRASRTMKKGAEQ